MSGFRQFTCPTVALLLSADAGAEIGHCIAEALETANGLRLPVAFMFNDVFVLVRPGDSFVELHERWDHRTHGNVWRAA